MDATQKVFESINDVSLNDILEYEHCVKMNEYKGYGKFVLHISEMSFKEFVKHLKTPIQEKDNSRYFVIITPRNNEQYLKFNDTSIDIHFESYYLDSQHHLKSYYMNVYESFSQHETFDQEFNQNLHKEIIKYLKTDKLDFWHTMYISKEDFVDATGIDKEDADNIEYVQVIFSDLREEYPVDAGMFARISNDNNKITLLDVDTSFKE